MAKLDILLRAAAIGSVLLAGSCAAPMNGDGDLLADPAANHPIAIEPGMQSLHLGVSSEGLMPGDAAQLDGFLSNYRLHGSGSIAINAPPGQAGRAAIGYFAERIAASGVPRDRILVSTREAPGDFKVEISFIAYRASTAPCGDWSQNLANTSDNLTPRNFGCAVQQNFAAVIADPRDLQSPRPMDGTDANRRAGIIDNYEQGKITSAEKRKGDLGNEQSGTSSDIGK
ncbi:MAG TPA: CpaD family pilus assembly protein [Rhizomicrobium sp.]|jgi:pilus assembly protein CpaD|nr:CpaD family pilus assembly protein [Rhizomicrobium sp.]